MKSLAGKIRKIWAQPIVAIEWVIAITGLIGSLYIFTPLYPIGKALHPTTFTMLLTHPLTIMSWGAVLLIGSSLVIIGLVRKSARLRSTGWFCIFLVRLYQVLAILIVAGPIPPQWFLPLTVGTIALILWARARREK